MQKDASEALHPLPVEEARKQLLAGEKLDKVSTGFLDLSNIDVENPICIENSMVQGLDLRGSAVKEHFSLNGSKLTGSLLCGTRDVFDKSASATFEGIVTFNNTVFEEDACFGNVVFREMVSFKHACFEKDASFYGVTFEKQAYLWATKFLGKAVFNQSKFKIEAHLSKISFASFAKFEAVEFGEEATFAEGRFDGYASFYGARFAGITVFSKVSFNQARLEEAHFENKVKFDKVHFREDTDFKKAVFDNIPDFSDALFEKKVSFREAEFNADAIFNYVRFFGLASYLATRFRCPVSFLNAQFHDESLFNFDENTQKSLQLKSDALAASFSGPADFTNVRFHRRAVFDGVKFQQKTAFSGSYFGEQAAFRGTIFSEQAFFEEISCSHELNLNGAHFQGKICFDHANVNRRLDLLDATFKEISFYGASIDVLMVEKPQVIGKMSSELSSPPAFSRAEKEYIILKESFGKRGMQDEEDWAYHRKKIMERKTDSALAYNSILGKTTEANAPGKIKSFWTLLKNALVFLVIDKGSGYGTQPLRITALAFALIFFFAAVYALNPGELTRPDQNAFDSAQAVYFSFATFTTMGFGDIQPKADSHMKYIVGLEAFFGIFVMTLFVGTYMRKIIR